MINKSKENKEIVFGLRAIIENIEAGNPISKIFINKNNSSDLSKQLIALAIKKEIPFSKVPKQKLDRITKKNHQGAIAYSSPINFSSLTNTVQNTFEKGEYPTILILDGITDTRNLGAIIRSACCMNISAVVIANKGGATITSDTMKTSAGALAHINICREKNLIDTINYLKNSGIEIIALSEKSNEYIYNFNLNKPLAIILGSEEKGIDTELLKLADKILKIPINGPIKSLNVSNASAILCYEIGRQRNIERA